MSSQKRERLLPYTAEQLFDLAADVERYPEYLPWWIAARIRKREANVYYTHQVLGLGPIRVSFGSKTVLQPPTQIDVTSKESPFQQFQLSWNFAALAGTGCRVSLTAEFELRSLILQQNPGSRSTNRYRRHNRGVRNTRPQPIRARRIICKSASRLKLRPSTARPWQQTRIRCSMASLRSREARRILLAPKQ